MAKFAVGDRVVITLKRPSDEYPGCSHQMLTLAGKEHVIDEALDRQCYKLRGVYWIWHSDWLEFTKPPEML